MLKFWLGFMRVHREVLLFGKLTPYHPELNYPLVVAETDAETVIAVYGAGTEVRVPGRPGTCCWIVNGSGADQLLLDLPLPAREAVRFDATGRRISGAPLAAGFPGYRSRSPDFWNFGSDVFRRTGTDSLKRRIFR